ncbi:uncharacterized protein LOC111861340, partial [Cryptotermes secundus]|uniref:uncharacterized protein LOC111861340 n=1 Tax=Cryptotermes secundus TaxID=105785 RepID=UPI000CD7CF7E
MGNTSYAQKRRSMKTGSPLMDLRTNGNKVPVQDDVVPLRKVGDLTQVPKQEVEETQVRASRARPVQASQNARGQRRVGRRRIVHFPIPDYSDVKPKVDSWRKNWRSGDKTSEVHDDVVTPRKVRGSYLTQVPLCDEEKTPESVPFVRITSPLVTMSEPRKPESRSVESNQILGDSMEKFIQELDNISKDSVVSTSTVCSEISDHEKK